jgi:hypothetical protein
MSSGFIHVRLILCNLHTVARKASQEIFVPRSGEGMVGRGQILSFLGVNILGRKKRGCKA